MFKLNGGHEPPESQNVQYGKYLNSDRFVKRPNDKFVDLVISKTIQTRYAKEISQNFHKQRLKPP
ncbi:MAG: hypothetical protein AAF497_13095, partial [Planctomycetota bacterium]